MKKISIIVLTVAAVLFLVIRMASSDPATIENPKSFGHGIFHFIGSGHALDEMVSKYLDQHPNLELIQLDASGIVICKEKKD